MALLFLFAGISCIRRPARLAQWMADAIKRASPDNAAQMAWVQGPGMVFFIRLMGFLALLNAVALFYIASRS